MMTSFFNFGSSEQFLFVLFLRATPSLRKRGDLTVFRPSSARVPSLSSQLGYFLSRFSLFRPEIFHPITFLPILWIFPKPSAMNSFFPLSLKTDVIFKEENFKLQTTWYSDSLRFLPNFSLFLVEQASFSKCLSQTHTHTQSLFPQVAPGRLRKFASVYVMCLVIENMRQYLFHFQLTRRRRVRERERKDKTICCVSIAFKTTGGRQWKQTVQRTKKYVSKSPFLLLSSRRRPLKQKAQRKTPKIERIAFGGFGRARKPSHTNTTRCHTRFAGKGLGFCLRESSQHRGRPSSYATSREKLDKDKTRENSKILPKFFTVLV